MKSLNSENFKIMSVEHTVFAIDQMFYAKNIL